LLGIDLPEDAPNPAVGADSGISDGDPGSGSPSWLTGRLVICGPPRLVKHCRAASGGGRRRRDPAAEHALELECDGDRDVVAVAAGCDLDAKREAVLGEAEWHLGHG
jgi:hypothetical protein